MTLRHIRIFVSVYQHGSITKAADALHLAQPSVSTAIKELEDYYGVPLFDRIGRHICPTEGAHEFYSYALHIVSLFDEMEKTIKNWDTIGSLSIGSSITIGTHILPALVGEFKKDFPNLKVKVTVSNSGDIEKYILDGSIDIGLIEAQTEHPDICSQSFMQDSLYAVLPPEHSLAKYQAISLSQLSKYPFLMREHGSAARKILDSCLAAAQLNVQPLWESTSSHAIISAVSEGLGVSVLPFMLVDRDMKDGRIVAVPLKPQLRRNLNIIYHKNKYLTPNMCAFIELCRKYGNSCEAH